jgi:hypothetical protein
VEWYLLSSICAYILAGVPINKIAKNKSAVIATLGILLLFISLLLSSKQKSQVTINGNSAIYLTYYALYPLSTKMGL